jgi:hypothetical protein
LMDNETASFEHAHHCAEFLVDHPNFVDQPEEDATAGILHYLHCTRVL